MKKQILKYSLTLSIVLFAFFSWFSVERAINVPGSSTWLVPIIFFSLFFIAVSLGVLIIKEKYLLTVALIISFGCGLLFTFSIGHIIILVLSYLLVSLAIEKIYQELRANIKLNIAKAMRAGRIYFVLALAFSITSQYTSEVINSEKANILPEVDLTYTISKIIPMVYPNLKGVNGESLTVDDFILEMSKKKSEGILNIIDDKILQNKITLSDENKTTEIMEINQEEVLKEGRENLSELSGREIVGQEKATDVFSEIINSQLAKYFAPELEKSDFPIITLFISFFLVLTILSLGPFLATISGYLAILIFWLFRKIDLVKISKVMIEVEVIE